MNGVFIIPTGIGAEIGGHAGDANPAAKLIASVCDKLIVHPNVVNASDINEMTPNMLYVEGSILDRFLEGTIALQEVRSNKILLIHNQPQNPKIINAVSAARVTIGVDISILELRHPLYMNAYIEDGVAKGALGNVDEAIEQVKKYDFDILIVNTPIIINIQDMIDYVRKDGGTNLWGGVEAMLSKQMSEALDKPVIHAPVESVETAETWKILANEIVDPRKAPETLSECCVQCCIKGAHKAPKIANPSGPTDFWIDDIDFMISPHGVWGRPHEACAKMNIPVIVVLENRTVLNNVQPNSKCIFVENYIEAAGMVSVMKAGISMESLRRPIGHTKVNN